MKRGVDREEFVYIAGLRERNVVSAGWIQQLSSIVANL
jgi:hypothetical protein